MSSYVAPTWYVCCVPKKHRAAIGAGSLLRFRDMSNGMDMQQSCLKSERIGSVRFSIAGARAKLLRYIHSYLGANQVIKSHSIYIRTYIAPSTTHHAEWVFFRLFKFELKSAKRVLSSSSEANAT